MIRKTGDKGTFYSGEKGTKKIGVDKLAMENDFLSVALGRIDGPSAKK